MKISESWVREWVSPDISTDQLAAQLTMAGLEVDAIEPVAGQFDSVVVGEIMEVSPHPQADRLKVCQVNDGIENRQIVCGAPNALVGMRVPLARVGAQLPGNFKIKRAKLRGVESQGMLCARNELGVEGDSSGLWELPGDAPVGQSIREYLRLDDQIIEVDLTPNRADCLSVRGTARELAVLNRQSLNEPSIPAVPASIEEQFPVQLQAPDACPRYVGRVIRGVDLGASTPLWIQEKLSRSGIRSIDPAVDVTNYVMLELGQPMHAFDLDRLNGGIAVRYAAAGETLTLLDGKQLDLDPDVLLITDDKGPLALAGIMGGKGSGVAADTRNIFLESAFFNPLSITGKARKFGLHTDASHRYERGVDFELQTQAAERATTLLLDICGGEAGPIIETVVNGSLPRPNQITLRKARLNLMLGHSIDSNEVKEILLSLGLRLTSHDETSWTLEPPSWRFDLAIEPDLIEEVARIYGYDRLPEKTPTSNQPLSEATESRLDDKLFAQHLVSRGFREVISYSFIDPKLHKNCMGEQMAVPIRNPIAADMSVMRTSIVPGLLQTAAHNLKRQQSDLRLFEMGQVFLAHNADWNMDELEQRQSIAGLMTGANHPESWANRRDPLDFFDLKREIELLLDLPNKGGYEFIVAEGNALYHPGQAAEVRRAGKCLGVLGRVHPRIQKTLDLNQEVFAFELSLDALGESRVPEFHPMSKYPEVRRDLALLVDRQLPSSQLLEAARKAAGELLSDARIFDIYEGQGIDSNKKSVGIGLTFRDYSRTLNEDDVTNLVKQIMDALNDEFGAVQR